MGLTTGGRGGAIVGREWDPARGVGGRGVEGLAADCGDSLLCESRRFGWKGPSIKVWYLNIDFGGTGGGRSSRVMSNWYGGQGSAMTVVDLSVPQGYVQHYQ